MMGQTPPPWHGQAVATKLLFDHEWPGFEIHRLRMEFSGEMVEVGRFQWKKLWHLGGLIVRARRALKEHPGCVLFYPPASAKWIPFLRDVIFLSCVRHLAGSTVFIFHAGGLPAFVRAGWLRRKFAKWAYHGPEVALEVAQEAVAPHEVFSARDWRWCPCAIEVPKAPELPPRTPPGRFTVLFVGSLQEGKGVLEMLKTARILRDRGQAERFLFRIVGKWFSTEFEKECRRLHEEWGLGNWVELVGELTGDAKWAAYYGADAFFFPTHYVSEASPLVIMEALGTGLPVVSTEWAGIPAMLDGCEAAVILPIKSPERYADALVRMACDSAGRERMGALAKAYYNDHFLPARFIGRVENAFRIAAKTGVSVAREVSEDTMELRVYLADQNPGYDRSIGISRMTQCVLSALDAGGQVMISTITSRSSQQGLGRAGDTVLRWDTRSKWVRFLTDHLHPLLRGGKDGSAVHYYPKGYLPWFCNRCRPSVVTIHDTIIQYDKDRYPHWRSRWEYGYWARVLRHTLQHADRILTISQSSKRQIETFMDRYGIPRKEIHVTYEPCAYEDLPQPETPVKEEFVMHLGSREPHKRTAQMVRWWHEAEQQGRSLAVLRLVGSCPAEVQDRLAEAKRIMRVPFLADASLQETYRAARALILPSEIEGFGLPALEAYYLGTPVCFVKGTSVEEVIGVATTKGGFNLDDPDSLFAALEEVLAMTAEEVRECGLKLRETYASAKVAERMLRVFEEVGGR